MIKLKKIDLQGAKGDLGERGQDGIGRLGVPGPQGAPVNFAKSNSSIILFLVSMAKMNSD